MLMSFELVTEDSAKHTSEQRDQGMTIKLINYRYFYPKLIDFEIQHHYPNHLSLFLRTGF